VTSTKQSRCTSVVLVGRTKMIERLKAIPCKHCGSVHSEVATSSGSHYDTVWISCLECGRTGPDDFNIDIAILGWNTVNTKEEDES
jgi:hypothetical protein